MASSLFVKAQAELRSYIQEHGLGPGDRLPSEGELATRFGVSRGAIREATRSLQTLGVIEAHHGNGLYVSAFSFRPIVEQLPYGLSYGGTQFSEIFQAREALETGLMSAVASLITADDLADCTRLAHEMDRLESIGEPTIDVDRDFHLSLYKVLGNSLVDGLIETFWDLYRGLDGTLPAPENPIRHAPFHLAIVEALLANDAAEAMLCMRRHFDDVRNRLEALDTPSAESV